MNAELKLAKVIKAKSPLKYKQEIKSWAKGAPYSQPIDRLLQQVSVTSKGLEYDWNPVVSGSLETDEAIVAVGIVSLSGVKRKNKSVIKDIPQYFTNRDNQLADFQIESVELDLDIVSASTSESKPSQKATKAANVDFKQDLSHAVDEIDDDDLFTLSDFTSWVVSKSGETDPEEELESIYEDEVTPDVVDIFSKAEKSIETRNNPTEKLAEILASQGHTAKAIKMYESLSLINPEKSGFFAQNIQKLKNRL